MSTLQQQAQQQTPPESPDTSASAAPARATAGAPVPRLQLPANPFSRSGTRLTGSTPGAPARMPLQQPAAAPAPVQQPTALPPQMPVAPPAPPVASAAPVPVPQSAQRVDLPPPGATPPAAAPAAAHQAAAPVHGLATEMAPPSLGAFPSEPAPGVGTAGMEPLAQPAAPGDPLGGVFGMPAPVVQAATSPAGWASHMAPHGQMVATPRVPDTPPLPVAPAPGHAPAPALTGTARLRRGAQLHAVIAATAAAVSSLALLLAGSIPGTAAQLLLTSLVMAVIALAWGAHRLRRMRDDARILSGGTGWVAWGTVALLPAIGAAARLGLLGTAGAGPEPSIGPGAVADAVASIASSLSLVALPLLVGATIAMSLRSNLSAVHQPRLVAAASAALIFGAGAAVTIATSTLLG